MKSALSMLLVIFLLAIVALALTPVKPTLAFDSYPAPNVHDRIIKLVSEAMGGFSPAVLKRIQSAARNQDWSETSLTYFLGFIPTGIAPNANYRPEHHFDRNTEAHTEADLHSQSKTAFMNGALYVKQQKEWFLGNLTVCTQPALEVGLDALGRALHALQDFFAHSNFVDLNSVDQAAAINALLGATAPPDNLSICYSPGYNQNETPDLYPHGGVNGFNKDNRQSSWEATRGPDGRTRGPDGQTKFDYAFQGAKNATVDFLTSCKQQVNNNTLWANKMGISVQVPNEIPDGWYPLWYNVTNSATLEGIPNANVKIYFANGTLVASFATNCGGNAGWYFPEAIYHYQVSAAGYQPYASGNFVLNTDMVYLVVSLAPPPPPPPPSVGGFIVPVDKLGLLAPYIGLASTTMIGTVASIVYFKRVKRRKEKQ